MIEALGAVIGIAMVGLLYRIAFSLGKMTSKLEDFCNKVLDHEDRLTKIEHPDG